MIKCNGSPDAAINTFFDFERRKHTSDGPLLRRTSLFPASIYLRKSFCTEHFPDTTLMSWERFYDSVTNPRKTTSSNEFSLARLRLLHPTKPEGQPAVDLLLKWYGSKPMTNISVSQGERLTISNTMTRILRFCNDDLRPHLEAVMQDLRAKLSFDVAETRLIGIEECKRMSARSPADSS